MSTGLGELSCNLATDFDGYESWIWLMCFIMMYLAEIIRWVPFSNTSHYILPSKMIFRMEFKLCLISFKRMNIRVKE
jgi:hypothetical protein